MLSILTDIKKNTILVLIDPSGTNVFPVGYSPNAVPVMYWLFTILHIRCLASAARCRIYVMGPGEQGGRGVTDWGGDTSGYHTKLQDTIQSPDRLYKDMADYTKPLKDYTKPHKDYAKT